ncbi:hypothetical protein HAX54_031813 [Datura stramonium]|uniref:Uncharacterized protein n=1 Tax=Datura stramonium TaxID=4076 RepID=A0ABS8SC52_DATST|nr:hypothetical protein [Datura stramonium]
MSPGLDPMEDVVTFPHDEYEVVNDILKIKSARGRAQIFISVSSIRGNTEQRTLDEKSKGCKNAAYDLSELAKKTNFVPPDFDPMEYDPSLPRDEVEVMQNIIR